MRKKEKIDWFLEVGWIFFFAYLAIGLFLIMIATGLRWIWDKATKVITGKKKLE
jgi:hypothetical protein